MRLTFLRGSSLEPMPPEVFSDPDGGAVDFRTTDELNEGQLAAWVRQASSMPG